MTHNDHGYLVDPGALLSLMKLGGLQPGDKVLVGNKKLFGLGGIKVRVAVLTKVNSPFGTKIMWDLPTTSPTKEWDERGLAGFVAPKYESDLLWLAPFNIVGWKRPKK